MKRIAVVLLLVASSCTFMDEDLNNIDPALRMHVDEFFRQANMRGLNIHPHNLHVHFKKLHGASGRTLYAIRHIFIDPTSNSWKYNPEALVFHELAHLYLKRDHDDTMYGEFCKSIMNGPRDPVYNNGFKSYRRQYYIDELFNPAEPMPAWMLEEL